MGAWDNYERREEEKEIEVNFATMLNISQSERKPTKNGQEPGMPGSITDRIQPSYNLRKLSKNAFKRKIKQTLFEILASEDCYIDLPEIVQKVKLNLFSS